MCGQTVNYMRQNYDRATEKLAFECDKSFSNATKNLHQQNSDIANEIIFVTIPYCTIYYLLYQEFIYCWIFDSISYSLV